MGRDEIIIVGGSGLFCIYRYQNQNVKKKLVSYFQKLEGWGVGQRRAGTGLGWARPGHCWNCEGG